MNNNPEDETTQSLNLIGSLYDSLVYAYTSTNKSLSNNHITAKVNDCLNQFSEHLGSDKFVQGVNSIKKQINDLIVGLLISSSTMTCIISTQVFETLKSPMLQADTILSIPGNLYEVIEKAGQYADSTSKSIDAASELNIKNDNLGRIHSASQDISYFSNQIQDIIKNGQEKLVSDYDSLEKWSDEEERKRKQRMKQMDIGEEIRQMQSITPSLVL
jgi:ABC-type transporter Mla subunit MlaD